jgi:Xaa-Pro aminopeptidase
MRSPKRSDTSVESIQRDASQRLSLCQQAMCAQRVDALFLSPGANQYYLSGFLEPPSERFLCLIVPAAGSPVFVAPEMYERQIGEACWLDPIEIVLWDDGRGPRAAIGRVLDDVSWRSRRVLIDDQMWASSAILLRELLSDCAFGVASSLLGDLRARKSDTELALLQEAAAITDEAFVSSVLCGGLVGLTETHLAARLRNALLEAEAPDIVGIMIASGAQSANPHYRGGTRVIEEGDSVTIDFGCRWRGYCSDMTRTVVCGPPSEELASVHHAVEEAQEAAFRSVRVGAYARDVDSIARQVLAKSGYADAFVHRTGHGVGLDIHEEPYIGSASETQLAAGMTFSIEPGVYLPGLFGVRIEDVVAVRDAGGERLNAIGHELFVLT